MKVNSTQQTFFSTMSDSDSDDDFEIPPPPVKKTTAPTKSLFDSIMEEDRREEACRIQANDMDISFLSDDDAGELKRVTQRGGIDDLFGGLADMKTAEVVQIDVKGSASIFQPIDTDSLPSTSFGSQPNGGDFQSLYTDASNTDQRGRTLDATNLHSLHEHLVLHNIPQHLDSLVSSRSLVSSTPLQPIICWLLRIVAFHPDPEIVDAAYLNLLTLVTSHPVILTECKVLTADLLREFFTAAGAIWIKSPDNRAVPEKERDKPEDDDEIPLTHQFIWTNMGNFLKAVELCLRSGMHTLTKEDISDLVVHLVLACIDGGVLDACRIAAQKALAAAVDAATVDGMWEAPKLEKVVNTLCNSQKELNIELDLASRVLIGRSIGYETPGARTLLATYCHHQLLHCVVEGAGIQRYITEHTDTNASEQGIVLAVAAMTSALAAAEERAKVIAVPDPNRRAAGDAAANRIYATVAFAQMLSYGKHWLEGGIGPKEKEATAQLLALCHKLEDILKDFLVDQIRDTKGILLLLKAECMIEHQQAGKKQATLGFTKD